MKELKSYDLTELDKELKDITSKEGMFYHPNDEIRNSMLNEFLHHVKRHFLIKKVASFQHHEDALEGLEWVEENMEDLPGRRNE